jgi:hypothetical protein
MSDEFKFKIAAGDRPVLSDTLLADSDIGSGNGGSSPVVVNLTGCTVKLLFQGPDVDFANPAEIVEADAGKVQYRFQSGETDVPGDYHASWQVIDPDGNVMTYPPEGFDFQIIPALPVAQPASFTKLSELYDDVRALAGDFKKRLFEDSVIRDAMRVQLRLGRVKTEDETGGTRWLLGPDMNTIIPAIGPNDVLAYSLLVYHTAHALVLPNMEGYSYRTRELSERFGERKDFLFNLQNVLHELENGDGIWSNITGLRSWLFNVNGIWVWSYMQTETNINLSVQ